MDHHSIIAFLRYIQRVQLMVKQAQKEDPDFRDVYRAAKVTYDLTYPTYKKEYK